MDSMLPESIIANYFENGILPRCEGRYRKALEECYLKNDNKYYLAKEISGEKKVLLLNILGKLGYIDYKSDDRYDETNEDDAESDRYVESSDQNMDSQRVSSDRNEISEEGNVNTETDRVGFYTEASCIDEDDSDKNISSSGVEFEEYVEDENDYGYHEEESFVSEKVDLNHNAVRTEDERIEKKDEPVVKHNNEETGREKDGDYSDKDIDQEVVKVEESISAFVTEPEVMDKTECCSCCSCSDEEEEVYHEKSDFEKDSFGKDSYGKDDYEKNLYEKQRDLASNYDEPVSEPTVERKVAEEIKTTVKIEDVSSEVYEGKPVLGRNDRSSSVHIHKTAKGTFSVISKVIAVVTLICGVAGVFFTYKYTQRIDYSLYAAIIVLAVFAFLYGLGDIIYFLRELSGRYVETVTTTKSKNDSVNLYPTRIKDKFGYIDKTGSIIIEPKFENCYYFYEDLAVVKVNNKEGYIDRTGEIVIEPQFDTANNFYEGVSKVKFGGRFYYINRKGEKIVNFNDYQFVGDFYDGMCSFKKDGKWGYFDNTGRIVIQQQYDDAYDFVGDFAKVKIGKDFAYINKNGKIIQKF